ncbi:hypothetical protein [Phytohabitans rumicis]|nr:hypothetical protein [Phytohabitans rumicis]
MVRRMLAAACLLALVGALAACGEEEKQSIGWPCNLLTEDEVEEAFGVPVVEESGVTGTDLTTCRWKGTGQTDDAVVELRTARTLDLVADYGSLDTRDEPWVRDTLAFDGNPGTGEGKTLVFADKGRSLGIQCRHVADGGRWAAETCADLAERALGRVADDDLDPAGKVAAQDVCDLLTEEEVRDLTGVRTAVNEGVEEDTPLGERGFESFECRWVESGAPADDLNRGLVTVWVQLRLADQCDEPVGGTGMFDKGAESYQVITDTQARVGAAKGEYCLHVQADKTAIWRFGGDLTEDEASKLLDSAAERLDAA